jgi:sigma-B regulation protein RsbU (phosphoserine phosphatase)
VTKDLRYLNLNPATRSELAVPLVVKDKVIGVLDLESTRKSFFTPGHQQMMELLAPQMAIAIENARLYERLAQEERRMERDLEAARELQRYLLPRGCPEIPGVEISARYEPAREIGGDLYDFVPTPGIEGESQGGLVIFTGDVSGKGAPAALYAAMVSGMLRNVAGQRLSPGEILELLNESLLDRQIEARYVCLACAYLDPATMTLEMANAGLPHPILCRAGEILPARVEGVPLGLLPDIDYETALVQLRPGDVAVFYSDGLIDNLNPSKEDYGSRRLTELILANCSESADRLVELIFKDVRAWAFGGRAYDDQTIVVLKAT